MESEKRREFICIVCPKCCVLEMVGDEIRGARCERGEQFARQEAVMPLRVVTTTLRCETPQGARMLPVKSATPVPLPRVLDMVKRIKELRLSEIPPLGSRIKLDCPGGALELIVAGE